MRRATRIGLAAAWLVGSAVRGVAAPATPEEAQRLTALLERYVGHPAGSRSAVTVVPHGESYTASLDITQMFAALPAAGTSVTAGPLTAELTPTADGKWRVVLDGFPPFGIVKDDQTSSVVLDGYKFDGVFDPAIRWFESATTANGGSSSHATGKQGTFDLKVTQAGVGSMKAVEAGPGKVTMTAEASSKDFSYAVTVPSDATAGGAGGAGMAAKVSIAGVQNKLDVTQLPIAAIEDLWQFLVAHPGKAELVANQAEYKTRLMALVPLSHATTIDVSLSRLAVESSLGPFALDSFTEHLTDTGPEANGGVFMRMGFAGLALPPGLVPPWALPLLPTSVDLGQSYGPVDAKPAAVMAIGALDLAADEPFTDAQKEAILASLNSNEATVTLGPSTIATPTLSLKIAGTLRLTKPLPTGSATVSASGLDKAIEAVRTAAAGDPTAAQVIAVLLAAKATGRAEGPDSYSWHIEGGPGGSVTVNGLDLAALAGQAAPPPVEAPAKPATKPRQQHKQK